MSTAPKYVPHYTVDDYQQWDGDWELWDGLPVAMTPSPFGRNSKLTVRMATIIQNVVDAAGCDAAVLVEIDWIVASDTVIRPDLVVVCGSEPETHVMETPAVVVEVLSESIRQRDLNFKRSIYQRQAVPYYLIIDPDTAELTALKLNQAGYSTMEISDSIDLEICDRCRLGLNVDRLFR